MQRFKWPSVVIICLCWLTLSGLRDPTQPLPAEPDAHISEDHWALHSVLISKNRRVAIINNQVLGVGDRLANFEIIAILPNAVQLRELENNKQLTLFLVAQKIKTKRK